jgi:hypothetical protein
MIPGSPARPEQVAAPRNWPIASSSALSQAGAKSDTMAKARSSALMKAIVTDLIFTATFFDNQKYIFFVV